MFFLRQGIRLGYVVLRVEESLSEVDPDEDSRATHVPGFDAEAAATKKRTRMSRRIERQAQLKR